MNRLARMAVVPVCPCGRHLMFPRHGRFVGDLIEMACEHCGWKGFSLESVPQPDVRLQSLSPVPHTEAQK